MSILGSIVLFVLVAADAAAADPSMPHLRRQGTATQLVVDGKPFLIRGGELGNSTASNPAYLRPLWARFAELNMNTVLAPVYWDLVEKEEGRFDFSTLDQLVADARTGGMRLVLLWFGSWKNSMSCYAPAWVKRDPRRFPRAADVDGTPQEILSPFSADNRDADARAFAAVLKHLREADGTSHTVLMVQVENEIGMIPSARDHGAEAERVFASAVPAELLAYLAAHREELAPELRAVWLGAGGKASGTWAEVFGSGPAGQDVFMAWHFARYTETVAAAGKRELPLPMFVNAALIRPGHQPGQLPGPFDARVIVTAVPATMNSSAAVARTSPPEGGGVPAGAPVGTITPSARDGGAPLLSAEEGRFVDGRWENVRWLSGDETHQGRHVRLEPGRFSVQRVRLYLY